MRWLNRAYSNNCAFCIKSDSLLAADDRAELLCLAQDAAGQRGGSGHRVGGARVVIPLGVVDGSAASSELLALVVSGSGAVVGDGEALIQLGVGEGVAAAAGGADRLVSVDSEETYYKEKVEKLKF